MSEVQRLAAVVAELQGQVLALARERRLANASMEGGAIPVYQPGTGGQPGVALGQQYDGTYAPVPLGGPTPPTPSTPSASGGVERLAVRWDGTYAAGPLTVAPQDWARVEVHASTTNTPGVLFETLRATIESPRGGEISVLGLTPDVDYWVWLVARSQSGKFSAPSQSIGPVRVTRLTVEDIDLADFGGNTIYRQLTPPTGDHRIGDLWLKTPENASYRWEGGDGWVPVDNVRISQALQDAFDAQQTANGANTAAIGAASAAEAAANTAAGKTTTFRQTSPPSSTGRTVGDEWIKTDSGNLRYVWSGTAWVAAPIGSAAIAPKSLIASDVIATGTVSAALLESVLVLATTIIAGNPAAAHVRITPTGFRVFRRDANGDGTPDEAIRLGTDTDDVIALVKADGSLAGSWASTGYLSVSGVTSQAWPQIAAPDHTGRGGSLVDILDRRGRGLVGWGSDTGIYDANTTGGRGIFDISAKLFYGRMYKICVKARVNSTQINEDLAELQIRYTWSSDGTPTVWRGAPPAPTINSPIAGRQQSSIAHPAAQGVYFEKIFSMGGGASSTYRNVRFLLCLARPAGSSTITLYGAGIDATEMWVEDIGPFVAPSLTSNDGGGTTGGPASQTQRVTRQWAANWHENYRPNGSAIALVGASQGHDPVNGNMRSYLGFSGGALDGSGVGLGDIIGSAIESVSLYLYSFHWYFDGGGSAEVGMHGFVNPPGSFGGGNERMVGNQWMQKPGGLWIDLSPAGFTNWANGTWRGIMLGATTGIDTLGYYGRFTDETDPYNKPILSVTYRR